MMFNRTIFNSSHCFALRARFHSHLCLIMMKPAHVNITIIVYANRRKYFCRQNQQHQQLTHKAFLCIFGVHRITNLRHIVYVNRFLTPSCFSLLSFSFITTERDVNTWRILLTELWSRVLSSYYFCYFFIFIWNEKFVRCSA